MDKRVELAIPDAVHTRCPDAGYKLRPVARCVDCPHFRGLSDRFPGSNRHAFAVRYAVLCAGEPTKRELFEVE